MSADSKDLEAKLKALEVRVEANEKKMKGYAGQIGVLKRGQAPPKPDSSGSEATSSGSKPEEAATTQQKHPVHSYEKFCPDCAAPIPDFKDETECKNCKAHLGAVAQVEKLAACPFCGSTSGAKKIA